MARPALPDEVAAAGEARGFRRTDFEVSDNGEHRQAGPRRQGDLAGALPRPGRSPAQAVASPSRTEAERFMTTVRADVVRGAYVDTSISTTGAEYARTWAAATAAQAADRPRGGLRHRAGTSPGLRWARGGSARCCPRRCKRGSPTAAGCCPRPPWPDSSPCCEASSRSAVLDRLVASSPAVRLTLPSNVRDRCRAPDGRTGPRPGRGDTDRNKAMVADPGRPRPAHRRAAGAASRVTWISCGALVRIETQFAGRSTVRTRPKTPRSRRTLSLPQMVADALAAHLAAVPGRRGRLSVRDQHEGDRSRPTATAPSSARRCAWPKLPVGTTSHALRHHYASLSAGRWGRVPSR